MALRVDRKVELQASQKKQDADQMILDYCAEQQPRYVFLDAPLSLPGVYLDQKGLSDFFYREADLALKAMSPMFLGGLTARAMRLSNQLQLAGIEVIEIYPAALARLLDLHAMGYKKKGKPEEVFHYLIQLFSWEIKPTEKISWHLVDALLAARSGERYLEGKANSYGNEVEGMIWV